MPSLNKTQRLKLNLWEPTDRPMRNDFNSDNILIDTVVGEHTNNSNIHLSAEEKAYLQKPVAVMNYTGNGESSRSFTLSEKAKLVIVFAHGKPAISANKVYFALGYTGLGALSGVSVAESGMEFTVSQFADSQGNTISLNENGTGYRVVMLR